jgi:calcium-dependent protein kinase
LVEQLGDKTTGTGKDNTTTKSITMKSVRTGHFANYLAMKRLKKVVLTYIASNLTQAEVGTLKEMFETMDTNKEGSISLVELDEAIARGNFSPKILQDLRQLRADHAVMIDGIDKLDNKKQKINWRDFVASTMDRSVALREQNVRMAFEYFRHSNTDYLTIDDLADIFGSETHANEVMDMLDLDHDGKVSYENFRLALVESMDNDDDDIGTDIPLENIPIALNET